MMDAKWLHKLKEFKWQPKKWLQDFEHSVKTFKLRPIHVIEVFVFLLMLLFLYPFYIVTINAAKPIAEIVRTPTSLPESFGMLWTNIQTILQASQIRYLQSFFNSVIITSISLVLIGVTSGMAAWVLVRTKSKISTAIFLLFVSGLVIPFQVVMLPLVRFLELITMWTGIGIRDTHHGVILAYMGFGAPLSVFLLHGFIKSIPLEIEEAAIIDGCNKPQLFFRIVLPILKPIFVTLLVLNGMWIWNDYLLPILIIGVGGSTQTLPLAVASLAGAYVRQWDLILTSVLMAAFPVVVLFLFAQKHIIKGMTSGAIK